jgi:hypothetical protein
MAVPGRVAAGLDLEVPHGEVGGAVGLADQPADSAAVRARHIDRLGFYVLAGLDFHGEFPLLESWKHTAVENQ